MNTLLAARRVGDAGHVHAVDLVEGMIDCTAIPNVLRAGVFAEVMGRVAAENIVAETTDGSPAPTTARATASWSFADGEHRLWCGQFFVKPEPAARTPEPSAEACCRKESFEAEQLRAWLGRRGPDYHPG